MANEKVTAIIDALKELSILDLADLKTAIQDEFGVDASAVAVAAPVEGGAAAAADEKTDFDVILTSAGAQKIAVIKAVREATGLGLKEAKALVDGAPAPVKEGVPAAEAEELKATLEAAGATIELK